DVAYFGGLINHVLQNNLFHDAYVRNYTNASFIVKEGYAFNDVLFSGYNADKRSYDISTWAYESIPPPPSPGEANATREGPATSGSGFAKRDMTLQDPRSVFQLMKAHYSRYTPEVVSSITGIPVADFKKVADLVGQMGQPDKVMTIVYAVGLTHHTTGGQLIRSGAVLQLLLGNMGRQRVMDDHLRPGSQGQDGGSDPVGHDGRQHRSRQQPGQAGPRQPQVARGDGSAPDDQLRVLARTGGRRQPGQDRGLHAADHP